MSKLDEAWEQFDALRKALRTARDNVVAADENAAVAGTHLDEVRIRAQAEAEAKIEDASRALSRALQIHAEAKEEIVRATKRLRVASEKIPQLLHAEVAGACGKDERADVEKALGDEA